MKSLQNFAIAAALLVGSVIYSAPVRNISDLSELSEKIEDLLQDYNHPVDYGMVATVFFSVSRHNTIQYVSVASSDSIVSSKLQKALTNKKLFGNKWRKGVIYELTVGHTNTPPVQAQT